MPSPTDRVYSKTHEWHQVSADGRTLTLGLTKFAVDQLTDVTFVSIKPAGAKFKAGDSIGEVESVKTTSDVYCAAGGEVAEVNKTLDSDPGLLNRDPYGAGWLCRVRVLDKAGLEACMKADRYDAEYPG
jgi:glycine cleavage system H protein